MVFVCSCWHCISAWLSCWRFISLENIPVMKVSMYTLEMPKRMCCNKINKKIRKNCFECNIFKGAVHRRGKLNSVLWTIYIWVQATPLTTFLFLIPFFALQNKGGVILTEELANFISGTSLQVLSKTPLASQWAFCPWKCKLRLWCHHSSWMEAHNDVYVWV